MQLQAEKGGSMAEKGSFGLNQTVQAEEAVPAEKDSFFFPTLENKVIFYCEVEIQW